MRTPHVSQTLGATSHEIGAAKESEEPCSLHASTLGIAQVQHAFAAVRSLVQLRSVNMYLRRDLKDPNARASRPRELRTLGLLVEHLARVGAPDIAQRTFDAMDQNKHVLYNGAWAIHAARGTVPRGSSDWAHTQRMLKAHYDAYSKHGLDLEAIIYLLSPASLLDVRRDKK